MTLCLVAVLAVVLMRGGHDEVEPARVDVPRASPADAAAALASFVAGVDARDPAALAALAPPNNSGAEETLSSIARNASALDLRAVAARYVDQIGTVAADGAWTGIVDLSWQIGDVDAEPSQSDVAVSFAPDGSGLGITGFDAGGDGRTRVPLWVRGELSVARADGVLVMVDGTRSEARKVVARAVRGIDVVRRVLPDWTSPVVVEVPGSAADLDETVGAPPGTYAAIAAVTAVAGSAVGPTAPIHVFVNPDITAGLRRAGAQVVMSHELVHVATDAVRTPVEPWLLEGFADYVALRDTKLPDRTTLGRAIESARTNGVPTDLPSAAEFDTQAPGLQARYEEAWLACRIIAERRGERGLLLVYEGALRGGQVNRVLRDYGPTSRQLTDAWRKRLRDLTHVNVDEEAESP